MSTAIATEEKTPAQAEANGAPGKLLWVIGVSLLVICCAFVAISLPFYWRQLDILRTWPEANAQILRAEVVPIRSVAPDGAPLYESHIQFLFTVNGEPHFAEDRSHRSPDIRRVRYETNKFVVGNHRKILYNPERYTDIRVNAGFNRRFFFIPLLITGFGALFGIASAIVFAIARRQRHRLTH